MFMQQKSINQAFGKFNNSHQVMGKLRMWNGSQKCFFNNNNNKKKIYYVACKKEKPTFKWN